MKMMMGNLYPNTYFIMFHLLLMLLFCGLNAENINPLGTQEETRVYIVYMGEKEHNDVELITSLHHQMLASVLGSKEAVADSMIYSYRHGFSGFAAKMTPSQAQTVADLPGVVNVIPNRLYKQHTTRSWNYLGLSASAKGNPLNANQGDGVIIGVIDSGIWPESSSFSDKGLGPIPSKWKGFCEQGTGFDPKKHCNNKLIGARYFIDGYRSEQSFNASEAGDYESPRDAAGHGTHCASVAAGSFVPNASYMGLATGTLRGGAPRARLAVYKVLWNDHASECDILKAFDEAIHDGVDVLSVSLGKDGPINPEISLKEGIYYGSFHAVAHGISVVCAGGNSGPISQTVQNVAPWAVSVAASSFDRSFPTSIVLGNRQAFAGQAKFVGKDTGFVELVLSSNRYCNSLTENDTWVTGMVVLCFTMGGPKGQIIRASTKVKNAGGLGLIVATENTLVSPPDPGIFPTLLVTFDIGTKILNYILSTSQPMVRLKPTRTYTGKQTSTFVASFSSRGPNSLSPSVLKPDVAAPGIDILAAYVPTQHRIGSRGIYAFDSGTSMATPHVAAIAALLKSVHPTWSPAAIRSAIVTTAWTSDPYSGEPIFAKGDRSKLADPFDYGGGVVNPNAANNPGLVYDIGTVDYVNYLCAMGYNLQNISRFTNRTRACSTSSRGSVLDLNLPSITVPDLKRSVTLTRTVTNVGNRSSVYKLIKRPPHGIVMNVRPNRLVFNSKVKKVMFRVTISSLRKVTTQFKFGTLTWTDGVHHVKIPVSVKAEYPI